MFSRRRGGAHPARNTSQAFGRNPPSKPRKPVAEQGLFINNVWHCNCRPRLVAKHLVAKKDGRNQGRWFYTCQKTQSEQCDFFLFDDDAEPRMKTTVKNDTKEGRSLQQENKLAASETRPEGRIPKPPKRRLPWLSDSTLSFSSTGTEAETDRREPESDLVEQHNSDNTIVLRDDVTATNDATRATRLGEPLELSSPQSLKRKSSHNTVEPMHPRKSLRFDMTAPQAAKTHTLNDSGLSRALLEEEDGLSSDSDSGIGYKEALELESVVLKSDVTPAKSAYLTPVSPGRYYDALKVPPDSMSMPKSPTTPSSAALLNIADDVFHVLARSPEKPIISLDIQRKLGDIFRKHKSQIHGLIRGRELMRDARTEALKRINYLQNRVACLEGEIEALRAVNSLGRE